MVSTKVENRSARIKKASQSREVGKCVTQVEKESQEMDDPPYGQVLETRQLKGLKQEAQSPQQQGVRDES